MSDAESLDAERPAAGRAVVVGDFRRPLAPDAGFGALPERSAASRRLAGWLSWLVPAALASLALHTPRTWLVFCLLAAYAAAVVRHLRADGAGPAGLLLAPLSALAGAARALINPNTFLGRGVPVLLWMLGISILLPGAVGALFWLIGEGGPGVLVAARSAVAQWGPALAATVACCCLLRTVLGPARHSSELRERAAALSEFALVAATVASFALLVPVALSASPAALRLVDLSPGFLDKTIDGWHRDWAQTEADAVFSCIRKRTGVAWTGAVRQDPADSSYLMVSIRQRGGGERPARTADTSAVVLSLHNQLVGSVRQMTLRRLPRRRPLVIDRSALKLLDRPLTDLDAMRRASGASVRVLPDSKHAVDTSLRCGASAL